MSDDFDFDSFLNDIKTDIEDNSPFVEVAPRQKAPEPPREPKMTSKPTPEEKAIRRQERAARMVEAGEKMQRAGERMQEAGRKTQKAGRGITRFFSLVVILIVVIVFLKSCGGSSDKAETRPQEQPQTQQVAVQEQTSTESMGEKNALQSAKTYTTIMHFSYEGLKEQLAFDGYTETEVQYAVDNCGADWTDQAKKAAKSYIDTMPFSYSGLIHQLEFDKFTTEQATAAVDECGADWMEQAARSAKNYLNVSSFSKDGLIGQLEYEGFTYEQAVYGVEQNGY